MTSPWPGSPRPGTSTAFVPVQARRSLKAPAPHTHHTTSTTTTAPASHVQSQSQSRSQSLGSAAAAAAAAPPPPQKQKTTWPPSVRQYVQRSFIPEFQIASVARADMEARLKQLITEAAESGQLATIDWDHMPLPQEVIRQERKTGVPFHIVPPAPPPAPVTAPSLRTRVLHQPSVTGPSPTMTAPTATVSDVPPWRKTASSSNAFERRVSHSSDKRRRLDLDESDPSKHGKLRTLELRKKRFEDGGVVSPYASASPSSTPTYTPPSGQHPPSGPIVGRCQKLEKNYFRLTSAPNPDTVRPLPVLEKTLELLKKKWRTENNYTYVCDQFKSLRQDLTVQHIRTEFTTTVYEIHARIALEKGDLGEYNQCQTQLRALYRRGLGGHPMEFLAYRFLYHIYTRNWTAINDALAELSDTAKAHPAVAHALAVRAALARGNYHRFFILYLDTPNMGAYLMDMFVDRERLTALACMCRAYKPDLPLRFITEELGFESDEQSARFILQHAPAELLQERQDGSVCLLTAKAGSVFEEARAAAHRLIDIKGQI